MVEQEQKDRTGQWFVDAKDPTKWYGPITYAAGDTWMMDEVYHGISESCIVAGLYLRTPPRPDLPPGLTTRACRLPEKGEMYMDLCGRIRQAIGDYRDAGLDNLYGWRRWIVEAEPEAEEPVQESASANPCVRKIVAQPEKPTPTAIPPAPVFDTDLREFVRMITQEDAGKHCINISDGRRLLNEIDKLTRELAEARAACATTEIWLRTLIGRKPVDVSAMKNALAGGTCRGELMKHGQSLLDELAKANMAWVKLARVCGCLEPGEDGKPACDPPCLACNPPLHAQIDIDELDRLRRLETAVGDDELVDSCAAKAVSSKPTRPEHTAINIYRAALLTTMKGE